MPQHPPKNKSFEWIIVIIIIFTAIVFRFQNIQSIPNGLHVAEAVNAKDAVTALTTGDYNVFYPDNNGREGLFINLEAKMVDIFDAAEPWVFRILPAIVGIFTVIGLYQLTRQILSREIAAISSFLMAISFWHTMFSRLAFRAILAPFFIVWGLSFLWRGKQTGKILPYGIAGLAFGMGILSYTAFSIILIILIITIAVYFSALNRDFAHEKYLETSHQILKGFAFMMIVIILTAMPLALYFNENPSVFLNKFSDPPEGIISNSSRSLVKDFGTTFGMFTAKGDSHWLFNIPDEPLILWPVGVIFLLGILKSALKLLRKHKEHGHFSTVQTLLLSWFLIGMVPALFAKEAPSAMLALIVSPVVFIFAGEGLWWIYEFIVNWYKMRDTHEAAIHGQHAPESVFIATLTVIVFLAAMMFVSYDKYFDRWAMNDNLKTVFTVEQLK